LGVTLFFFISSYLITGLLIDEYETTGGIDIKYFYVRRFMRLAPALLTMVAVVSLTYLLLFGATSIKEILAAVFYFMNYYQITGGAMPIPLGPLWSLGIEENDLGCRGRPRFSNLHGNRHPHRLDCLRNTSLDRDSTEAAIGLAYQPLL
jgi:hypothetical protein